LLQEAVQEEIMRLVVVVQVDFVQQLQQLVAVEV
jgi:hypothetical protein